MARSITLDVHELSLKGEGIGEYKGKRVKVDFAYPGDRVVARLFGRGKAKAERVLKPSELRSSAPCSAFSVCGSCRWQGLSYKAQIDFKAERIERLFGIKAEVKPSPKIWYYRNRMDFTVGREAIGMRRYGSYYKVARARRCLLQSEESNEIIRRSEIFFRNNKLKPYNLRRHRGFLRYIVIREGKFTGDRLVTVITSEGEFPLREYYEEIKELSPKVLWAVNSTMSDVSQGEIREVRGESFFEERLLNLNFRIPAFSFFQTNSYQAENLVSIAVEEANLDDSEVVADLYSGVGTFSLALAQKAGEVIGIEEDIKAVKAAEENAELNGVKNVRFIAAKVEEALSSLEKVDVALLDPPRAGLHKKVIRALLELKPRKIVYVSCNPVSQKEDIERLRGYRLEKILPLDMFPHTPHLENIAILKRL